MASVSSTIEDSKTTLKMAIAYVIKTTSRLSFTLCSSEFIYAEVKNKHVGEDYGRENLKVMTTSLDRHCT